MRRQVLAMLVVLGAPGPAPAKGAYGEWPTAGRCLVNEYRGDQPCVMVTARDAKAIRSAVQRRLERPSARKRRDWRGARALARLEGSEHMIAGFFVEGYAFEGHRGDVVRLKAADGMEHGKHKGYRIILGRTPAGGWTVLDIDVHRQARPQPYR